jgi:hypothetical protein
VGEYWGWAAIAKRLGVSIPTAKKWYADLGLFAYRRNMPNGRPPRCRWCWYSNDQLILAWELARVKLDRHHKGFVSTVAPEPASER